MYEWQKKYWKLLIICALVCLACLFISWIFIAIIAHLGSWIIITIDFISSLFRFIGINNPVGAWFLLGCVIGGNFGLIKSAKIPGINIKNTDKELIKIEMNPSTRGGAAGSSQYDHFIKLIIIGDTSVGKTSLLLWFAENTFSNQHIATIGKCEKNRKIEFCSMQILIFHFYWHRNRL